MSFWYDANKKEYASDGRNGWIKAFCVKICNEVKTDVLNLINEVRELLQSHFSGDKNRHTAYDVDYSSSQTVKQKIDAVQSNVNAEATDRQSADNTLRTSINNEITARQSADNTLRTSINSETTARQNADDSIRSDLGDKNVLDTNDKTDIVSAINELKNDISNSNNIPVKIRSDWADTEDLSTKITVFENAWTEWSDGDCGLPEIPIVIWTSQIDNDKYPYWTHRLLSHTGNLYEKTVSEQPSGSMSAGNWIKVSPDAINADDLQAVAFSGSYTDLINKPTSMTPTSHATSSTTYGAGTASNYGHLKLSDSISSTSNTNSGTAATPSAVKQAYDLAKIKKKTATIVVGSSAAGYTTDDVDYLCGDSSAQTQINNAISALPSCGGKIILLEGTYNCSGQINVNKANVVLEGMGIGNTTLNFQATNYGINVSKAHCTVKNLTVTRTGEISGESRGIRGNNGSDFFTVSNAEVSNYLWGIETMAKNVFIEKAYAHDNFMGVHTGSTYGIITNCMCIDNSEAGINIEGKYLKIANNHVYAGTGQASDYTSSQYTLRSRYSAAYNDFSDNYIPGKNYTNNAGSTNTFNNNRYQ